MRRGELTETRELGRRWRRKGWLRSAQLRFASVAGPTGKKAWIHSAHFIQMLRVYKAIRRDRQTRRETREGENADEGSRWGREGRSGARERDRDTHRGAVPLRGGEDAEKGILQTAVCFGSSSKLVIGVRSFNAYSNFEKCGAASPTYKGGN